MLRSSILVLSSYSAMTSINMNIGTVKRNGSGSLNIQTLVSIYYLQTLLCWSSTNTRLAQDGGSPW